MPPNPLANWEKVGDSFYRKIAVYDAIFEDDVELENYIVAGAPYGGAIGESPLENRRSGLTWIPALYRDESKPFRLRDGQGSRSTIDVYSCSGQKINRINVCLHFMIES